MQTSAKSQISCRIRQIYFKPVQIGKLDALWHPYLNTTLYPTFENEVIRTLYNASDSKGSDYYGVFSHKFFDKHHKDGRTLERLMGMDEYSHDIYSFFGKSQDMRSKQNTFFDTFHPHLLEIGREIVKRLFNVEIHTIKAGRIYYNHWVAKTEVWNAYCKEMLLPAMDLLDGELNEIAMQDATYRLRRGIDPQVARVMSPDECLKAWGLPYYPHTPFVLERLPSIYFALKKHSIKQL